MSCRNVPQSGDVYGYLKVVKQVSNPYGGTGRYFLCKCKYGHHQMLPTIKLLDVRRLRLYCNSCLAEKKVVKKVEVLPDTTRNYGCWKLLTRLKRDGHFTQLYLCECTQCGEQKKFAIKKILSKKGLPECSEITGFKKDERYEARYADSERAIRYVNEEREREKMRKR